MEEITDSLEALDGLFGTRYMDSLHISLVAGRSESLGGELVLVVRPSIWQEAIMHASAAKSRRKPAVKQSNSRRRPLNEAPKVGDSDRFYVRKSRKIEATCFLFSRRSPSVTQRYVKR
jgi:hypothetical protein